MVIFCRGIRGRENCEWLVELHPPHSGCRFRLFYPSLNIYAADEEPECQ
jgi:hypothetical protein